MNTIWLKLAGAVVVILIVIVVASKFMGGNSTSTPAPEPQKDKTFYDMADRDKQFGQEPERVEQETAQPQVSAQPTVAGPNVAAVPAAPPAQLAPPQTHKYVLPSDIANKQTTIYVKPMSEEEELGASQLPSWAAATRSMGRLPLLQYGPSVKACRQILSQWPDSWYAFRAKQILGEIHNSGKGAQYNITEADLDISKFLKPRPGWEKRVVEPVK
jgi:hypothetical protein